MYNFLKKRNGVPRKTHPWSALSSHGQGILWCDHQSHPRVPQCSFQRFLFPSPKPPTVQISHLHLSAGGTSDIWAQWPSTLLKTHSSVYPSFSARYLNAVPCAWTLHCMWEVSKVSLGILNQLLDYWSRLHLGGVLFYVEALIPPKGIHPYVVLPLSLTSCSHSWHVTNTPASLVLFWCLTQQLVQNTS